MTIAIIAITVLVSLVAFNNREWFEKLQLNPYQVYHSNQWYRVLSHGFLHADWIHLFVNMIVLFSFGEAVEQRLSIMESKGMIANSTLHFLILYFAGMIIATSTTIQKHKDNYHYNAIGASGAVSAVVFAFIFFSPTSTLLLMGVIPIPAFLFGILYLIYSQYMRKRQGDRVNHDAHFVGAVFGFVYPILLEPGMIKYFFNQLF